MTETTDHLEPKEGEEGAEGTHDTIEDFASFSDVIARGIEDLGWETPMPVQKRVIPRMRLGHDLIVQAVTGSGKTGAFGLPIIELIDVGLKEPQALVLAPTRELANQICNELTAMGRHIDLEAVAVYGGTAYGPQLEAFERGAQVVVGTPGRLLDHLKSKRLHFDALKVLVFDEADELLGLGFWPDMKEIAEYLPKKRQTGLFSATMPERVRSLSRFFLIEPEFISLTTGGVRSPEEIEHCHYIVSAQEKDQALLQILEHEDPDSAIIFCNTRDDTRYVSRFLQRNHFDADMIQGEMTQAAREKVMKRIKEGKLRFLVATDVAARGIDISDLSHVIAYSSPDQPEVYLHRTGRTGRAGRTGTAISLVSGLDIGNFHYMQKVNRMTIAERKLPSDADTIARRVQRVQVRIEHDLRGLGERERRTREEKLLPVVEHMAANETGRRELAALLYEYLESPEKVHGSSEPEPEPEASEERAEERPRDDDREDPDRPQRKRRRRRR
jgi:ATP-dependent RNA helicase DeaD